MNGFASEQVSALNRLTLFRDDLTLFENQAGQDAGWFHLVIHLNAP